MTLIARAVPLAMALAVVRAAVGQESPATPPAKLDYSGEAFVFDDETSKIVFENDGTSVRETTSRLRIQSDAAVQNYGILNFNYQSSFEKLEIVYVRVRKPDGTVVVTPAENIQDMPAAITREAPYYSDLQEKHVSVKGLSVGDTLETRAVWRMDRAIVPGEFAFTFNWSPDFIVLHRELQVSTPRDRPLKWVSVADQPTMMEEGPRRVFTWTGSTLTRRPPEVEKAQREQAAYESGRGILPAPDIAMSTFQSWEAVGAWSAALMRERAKPTPEIRAKAVELTKDAADEDAKLRAIYKFVSGQIRYIGVAFGVGRYQPHPAAEVLSNQYGDCKDKHTLLASLLDAVGIKAYPALISSGHVLDLSVPYPGQFDHVITAVPRGDGYVWLDSTAEVAPFGYLVQRLRDKPALVVRGEQTSALVRTPADPPAPGRQTFLMKATLSDAGKLEGSTEVSIGGSDSELVLRGAFRATAMAQWRDLVQLISNRSGFGGEVSDVTASSPLNTEEPLRWSYKYTREEYSDWANRRIRPPLPPIAVTDPGDKPTHDLWMGPPSDVHFEASVRLPEGSQPELPPNRELKEPFADYTATYAFREGVLTADRRLVVKQREVSLTALEAYRRFSKALLEDQEALIDLNAAPKVTPFDYQEAIWDLPYSGNDEAARAYDDARASSKQKKSEDTIMALKRAVALDPGFTRAWLWLGDEYRYEKKEKLALEAYRSAIKNAPLERLSYRVLAFNLTLLERYEEAIATWRQLIAVAPDDSEAYAYMGVTLSQLKREEEAVAALESAVKLDPNREDLFAQLGVAYASRGKEEKAVEAFQRGLGKNPRSDVLNAAAYSLADNNLQLSLALDYAEKAVRMEEAVSAKLSLADLKAGDLASPVRLAADWDTLGWVYFRMGRLDLAEKYVKASWALEQSPIVADHLGQIYERQGKPDQATRMYELALAATRKPEAAKETRARLKRILGGTAPAVVDVARREELTQLRTVKLVPVSSANVSAEFFLLVGPGSKVLETRFVSGDSKLKAADKALRAAALAMPFPSDDPTLLVRRGVVSCSSMSGCSIVLYPASRVRSLD